MPLSREYRFRVRTLRKNSTEVEKMLWAMLRGRRLLGFKFRRQVAVDRFIVDFYCEEKLLVIELDGSQHVDDVGQREYEEERSRYLEALGMKVLRFMNNEVNENLEGVLEVIVGELEG